MSGKVSDIQKLFTNHATGCSNWLIHVHLEDGLLLNGESDIDKPDYNAYKVSERQHNSSRPFIQHNPGKPVQNKSQNACNSHVTDSLLQPAWWTWYLRIHVTYVMGGYKRPIQRCNLLSVFYSHHRSCTVSWLLSAEISRCQKQFRALSVIRAA